MINITLLYSQTTKVSSEKDCPYYHYKNLEVNKEMVIAVSWNGMGRYDYQTKIDLSIFRTEMSSLFNEHFFESLPFVVDFYELIKPNGFDSINNLWEMARDPLNGADDSISQYDALAYICMVRSKPRPASDFSNYYMKYFLRYIIPDDKLKPWRNYNQNNSISELPKLPENHFIIPLTNLNYKSFRSELYSNYNFGNDVFIFQCKMTFLSVGKHYYSFPNLKYKAPTKRKRYRDRIIGQDIEIHQIYNVTDIKPLSKLEIKDIIENNKSLKPSQVRTLKKWNPMIFKNIEK
jgi:hypothetical protein